MEMIVFWISMALIAVTLGIKTWLTEGQPVVGWIRRPNQDKQQFKEIEKLFLRYLTLTYIEMRGNDNEFSPRHRQIEEEFLAYAGDELAQEMKNLHSVIYFQTNPAQRIVKINKVIDAFKKQFAEERAGE